MPPRYQCYHYAPTRPHSHGYSYIAQTLTPNRRLRPPPCLLFLFTKLIIYPDNLSLCDTMAVIETNHVVDLAALAGLGVVISVRTCLTFSGLGL